jgi:hypothetical protein
MKLMHKFFGLLRDESGSVETGLVLIPVMLLFLSVLQLPASTLARVAFASKLQSDTYVQSFVDTGSGAYSINLNRSKSVEGPTELLPMPGGGELVVKNRRVVTPPITPLLIGGDQFNSVGISVNENK